MSDAKGYTGLGESPGDGEVNHMTSLCSHRIRNDRLRSSTLRVAQGDSPQYWTRKKHFVFLCGPGSATPHH